MRKTSFLVSIAAALAVAPAAFAFAPPRAGAQPERASDLVPPAYRAALPAEQTQGEVSFIAGGNTEREANAIKRASQDFPLELVFRQTVNGKVTDLTDVPVTIKDASGKVVFEGESPGPYFIARLPAGRYSVTAHWDQWDFSKDITIGTDRDRVVFAWKRGTPNTG
jgi:hypothetical protein